MPAALALPRSSPPDPRQFQRCLLLAVLLHVWLVLVFGNATGTAAPGQGVWGSLTVKLLGRSGGEPGAPPGDPAPEWRDNGAPGDGNPQRQGGQVRPTAPTDTQQTGAAELGRWNPREVAPEAARTEELSDAAPSTATLNLPEGFKPIERDNLSTPAARTTPLPTPTAELPAAVGRLEARPDTTVTPLPSAASLRTPERAVEVPTLPADLPATVNRLDATTAPARTATLPRPAELRAAPPTAVPPPSAELPAAVQRLEAPTPPTAAATLPRPSELRAAPSVAAPALPTATPLPSTVQRLEAPTQPSATATLPRPSELRAAPSATAAVVPPSTALPSAVQRLETAPSSASVSPLNRASELRSPSSTSNAAAAANALPNGQDLPAPVKRLEAGENGSQVTPLQPTANPRASLGSPSGTALPDLSTALPGQVNAPAGPARGDPTADPYAAPKASAGSPDAGSRLGADVAVPPSASASAPRAPLNLSLPRSGDIAARRGPGLIELLPQPPERKSKLEQSIEDATNKDCRKAYANTGILAAIPLAVDAARGKGCKW